jgi:hypothetical protein
MCSANRHVRFTPNSDRNSGRSVNGPANHQGQQIYFGIAATDGHDADPVCIFVG